MPRISLDLTWKLLTPMSIAGAPSDKPLVDVPLLKQYIAGGWSPKILLPASTIKGKLRAEAQRLLNTFAQGELLCPGRTAETMCPAYWWDQQNSPPGGLCRLCRLFGSPWHPSELKFKDVTARVEAEAAMIRPGVSLSRVRGTAQEDLLFFVETTPVLEGEVKFANCSIEGEVPDEESAALLWMAVRRVVAFGNGRSRGLGWVQIQNLELKVGEKPWDSEKVGQVWSRCLEKLQKEDKNKHG